MTRIGKGRGKEEGKSMRHGGYSYLHRQLKNTAMAGSGS
jgi:hypothetical protein